MDTKWEVLRGWIAEWNSVVGEKNMILYEFRQEIHSTYIRFFRTRTQSSLNTEWKRILLSSDAASREFALLLQSIEKDPAVFGLETIKLNDDSWLGNFLDRLGKTRLLQPGLLPEQADKKAERFLLDWLICVERGDSLLQKSVRQATLTLEQRDSSWEPVDAFDYLAAASLLLIRCAPLSWHRAVEKFRSKVKQLNPEKNLRAPTQWRPQTSDQLTDWELRKAFQSLSEQQNPEICLSTLVKEPSIELLRKFIDLPIPYTDDYVNLMKNYLLTRVAEIHRRKIPEKQLTITFLSDTLRTWAAQEEFENETEDGRSSSNFSELFLPPNWVLQKLSKTDQKSADEKGKEQAKAEQKTVRTKKKVDFRALRYILFLLLGLRQDFYGHESDMRLLLLRLGLACNLPSKELQNLLNEQEMPGIDFKTAPELLLAYGADHFRVQDNQSSSLSPPANAYASAMLMLRVYRLLKEENTDTASSKHLLEATQFIRDPYWNQHIWELPPADFLKWMWNREMPSRSTEELLTNGRWHKAEPNLQVVSLELLRTLRAIFLLNEEGIKMILEMKKQALHDKVLPTLRETLFNKLEEEEKSKEQINAFKQKREFLDDLLKQINQGRFEEEKSALGERLDSLFEPDDRIWSDIYALPKKRNDLARAKNRDSLLWRFFPNSEVRKALFAFFPYDPGEWLGLPVEVRLNNNAITMLRRRAVLRICDSTLSRRLLSRDDFLCLLFTEFLVSHGLQLKLDREIARNFLFKFEQEQEANLREARMLPFHKDQEPKMVQAFQKSITAYNSFQSHFRKYYNNVSFRL